MTVCIIYKKADLRIRFSGFGDPILADHIIEKGFQIVVFGFYTPHKRILAPNELGQLGVGLLGAVRHELKGFRRNEADLAHKFQAN